MAPPPEPIMSWTGFYLGAGGGLSWADLDVNNKFCQLDYDGVDCYGDEWRRDFSDSSDVGGVGIVQGGFDYESIACWGAIASEKCSLKSGGEVQVHPSQSLLSLLTPSF